MKESYQTIPRSEILFKHDDDRNRDFFCTFELTADNATTKISAVASIKEVSFTEYGGYKEKNISTVLITFDQALKILVALL